MDWKWLFIYPEQGVATVNELTVPVGTPVNFQLTSFTVMTAFFVPQLGSMIYTMPGMTTRLNLQADRPGDYPGLASHFSGNGFSDMHFLLHAVPAPDFASWASSTKSAAELDEKALAALKQNTTVAPAAYHNTDPELFDRFLQDSTKPPGEAGAPHRESDLPGKEK